MICLLFVIVWLKKLLSSKRRSNSTETVELLLQHGADPCLQTESQMSALHLATRAGNKAIVQSLLRAPNTAVNARNKADVTSLHLACGRGFMEVCEMLLRNGAKVDVRTIEGVTPLSFAARNVDAGIASLILEEGRWWKFSLDSCLQLHAFFRRLLLILTEVSHYNFAPSSTDSQNIISYNTWKLKMIKFCKNSFSKIWLQKRQHVSLKYNSIAATPTLFWWSEIKAWRQLFISAIERHVDVDQLVNNEDCRRCTPLHSAARFGSLAVTELLLQHGARGDAVNEQGQTPLHLASICGMTQVVGKLISAGACANRADTLHRTPLHWCVIRGFRTCYSWGSDFVCLSSAYPDI